MIPLIFINLKIKLHFGQTAKKVEAGPLSVRFCRGQTGRRVMGDLRLARAGPLKHVLSLLLELSFFLSDLGAISPR